MYAQTYHAVQAEVGLKMAVFCLVMAASVGYKARRFERTCRLHLHRKVLMTCYDTRHDFPEDSGPQIYRCTADVSYLKNFSVINETI